MSVHLSNLFCVLCQGLYAYRNRKHSLGGLKIFLLSLAHAQITLTAFQESVTLVTTEENTLTCNQLQPMVNTRFSLGVICSMVGHIMSCDRYCKRAQQRFTQILMS